MKNYGVFNFSSSPQHLPIPYIGGCDFVLAIYDSATSSLTSWRGQFLQTVVIGAEEGVSELEF